MRVLYHLPLSPFCRKVRIALKEKGLPFELRREDPWRRRAEFLELNPAGTVPVLVEAEGTVVADSMAIAEYLQEVEPQPDLLGGGPVQRAEARRLVAWFDGKMHREVTARLLGERVLKRFVRRGEPDSNALRAGLRNIGLHLDYIGYLAERGTWLAGDRFTLADIAAAAQLSCIDYLGDAPWGEHRAARDWYARVKSRPSFRPVLEDRLPQLDPAPHYDDPDF